jgi:integrase/recombinase XerC
MTASNSRITVMRKPHPWIERFRAHLEAAGRFEPNTITSRCELLYRLNRELPLGLLEATIEELENWLAGGRTPRAEGRPGRPWSRQSKATYYGHITSFYRWASDPNRTPHLSFDPSTSLCRPKVPEGVPKPCENGELERILGGVRGMYLVYCLLSAYAGLRPIQISNLMREDITDDQTYVKGKGGKTTAIPTHPAIWDAVRDFPRGPIAIVRIREVTWAATPDHISTCTSREIERALGYPGITLRSLRHWYATTLLKEKELGGAGANLRTVQELMGHSSVATTAIYTKVVGKQRKMAISALPPLAPTSS